MCNIRNPNMGLLTFQKYEYQIPLCIVLGPGPGCEVYCCNMEKPVWDQIINQAVINPIQMAVSTKILETRVQALTTRVEALSKPAARVQTKKAI